MNLINTCILCAKLYTIIKYICQFDESHTHTNTICTSKKQQKDFKGSGTLDALSNSRTQINLNNRRKLTHPNPFNLNNF